MANELIQEVDTSFSLEDPSESELSRLEPLVEMVTSAWGRAKRSRQENEHTWSRCYSNYRGLYGRDLQFREDEKSRAFVKISKTKTHAAFAQICDILFAGDDFPISITPTKEPLGISEKVFVDVPKLVPGATPGVEEQSEEGPGIGSGQPLIPGTGLRAVLGSFLGKVFKDAPQNAIKEGAGQSPEHVTLKPADLAAMKMQRKIMDQLEETTAITHLRNAIFECTLLGTGIVKGPFTETREYPSWNQDTGMYEPVLKDMPRVEHVPVWNFYTDPEAKCLAECEWVIERHIVSRSKLRALSKRPFFFEDVIEDVVAGGPNHQDEWWENVLDDSQISEGTQRYDVLEYWGTCNAKTLREYMSLPSEFDDAKDIQVNIFVSGHKLLRVVVNPFKPRRIPYHLVPYETNPYNIWGVGIVENMEDSQTIINGFTRLLIDNAVLSSNLMLEVDETYLKPGQDLKAYPGKVWVRNGGPPGQAIFSVKWNNVTNEIVQVWDKFRSIADESTGIPSISHGQSGISGTGRTASGMSMLMGAAALAIKSVVKNIDDFLLQPLGESMFSWNMQFDPDPDIKGDLAVKARGTSSVMMKEIKSQRYLQFLQAASNPAIAPLVKMPTLIKELAKSMDLDSDDIINDPADAQVYAKLIGMMKQATVGDPAAAVDPDLSGNGGGNVAPAAPTGPGQPGFTGTPQQPAPPGPPTGPSPTGPAPGMGMS